ncbi:MAG: ABC transporter ATP-binding protein [Chitinophagaceae bacterium]|nr:ABC transporter ATP-binding protein [Chitinophagaceae bacterium]
MSQPVLQVKNLSVAFATETGDKTVLQDISFVLSPGEVLAIVGESGSGKSVTALSILRLLPVPPARITQGQIIFSPDQHESIDLLTADKQTMRSVRGGRIGMIFQEPMSSLNPVFTCGHQITEAIQTHYKVSKKEAKEKAIHWLERVKLPDPVSLYDRYPHELSGGQKQRVMIAMAMCGNPSLLICDEPTTALDVTVQKAILDLIRELQQETGMSVIFITHDLGVVAEIADRCLVMYKGKIVEENKTATLFADPQHPYTKGLLACRPVNHPKGKRLPVVSDFLSGLSALKTETPTQITAPFVSTDLLLEVKNLEVHFRQSGGLFTKKQKTIKAVDGVSFDLRKGETLGLVGESGCGKTTLGRTLLRLIEPTAGQIIYQGKDLMQLKRKELLPYRKEMQLVFQDPYGSLNPRLRIGDALMEPLKVHQPGHNARQRKDQVVELLEKTGLTAGHFDHYPHQFSGGQRQRVVIARALILNPSFVVCDESVSALDVSVQAQVLNLLNDLKKEYGFTILFISHDLSVVHYLSDRILVMHQGKIVEAGEAEEVYLRPKEEYTRRLIASIPGKMTDDR